MHTQSDTISFFRAPMILNDSFSMRLRRAHWRMLTCLCLVLAGVPLAQAAGVEARVRARGQLHVCIWPDFYGVTFRNPHTQALSGIDIELSRSFAEDLGVGVSYVDSSFFAISDDLLSERCDVGMFAIGMRSLRTSVLSFSQPYMQSRVYALVSKSQRQIQSWQDIDQPGVVVGVQEGAFLEPLMRDTLIHARLYAVRPPTNREKELQSGRIDVFVSDYPNSRRLLDRNDAFRLIEPDQQSVTLPYAYAVKPGDTQWLDRLNQFVESIKQDGRLKQAAHNHGLLPMISQ